MVIIIICYIVSDSRIIFIVHLYKKLRLNIYYPGGKEHINMDRLKFG